MKRDFLTNLGLEGEQVDQIMAEHGKTVNALKDDADKSGDLQQQIEDLQEQLKDRDKQLKKLEKSAEGNEDLQQQIKDLQKANDDTKQEYEEKLEQQKKDSKLELALKDAEAKNPRAVKALLAQDDIKLDGDKLLGLDEQLTTLKESDPYLFGEEPKLGGRTPTPGSKQQPNKDNPFKKDNWNMTKQVQMTREDPDKARALIAEAGLDVKNYGL